MNPRYIALALLVVIPAVSHAQQLRTVQTRIADGLVEGVVSADNQVRTFKGIPFAAPPVGALRWAPPQPVVPWTGVLRTVDYGPRPMQDRVFDDMVFHDDGPSEDCLYLNLWLPENHGPEKLPVMVWIFGGGFVAGSTSEPRQDGGNLCKKGVLIVSANYRLGVFGLLSHPALTKESGCGASGNYGILDQIAALKWVKRNIAAFGGDPENVTIFGESAGSSSVSALVASPLAKGLFNRAIGESGTVFNPSAKMATLAEGEAKGVALAAQLGKTTIDELRSLPASEIMASLKAHPIRFSLVVDGRVFPQDATSIYLSGAQNRVPLLVGWNRDEGRNAIFGKEPPTLARYTERVRAKLGDKVEAVLREYPATTDAEAAGASTELGVDISNSYKTWKWLGAQAAAGAPVYRYRFDQYLPAPVNGAPHAGEIEYVFRVLSSRNLPWTEADRQSSEVISTYWTNFAKTGSPNGAGLPAWPMYLAEGGYPIMHLEPRPHAEPDSHLAHYKLLDSVLTASKN
jgi:para-nitrobenzyl esterase